MKKITLLLSIIISLNGFSQNLVPNPSFEQYVLCPDNDYQISYCVSWDSYRESPDYFNTCSTSFNYAPPECYYGFQYPHSGNAYAGFSPFSSQIQNYRELMGANLLSTLLTGQKYFISFYINLGGNVFRGATIASNKTGVRFSTVPYSYSNPAPINNSAQFYCNTIISDTIKWTRISGSFIADSAYNYIIIGNFFTDSLTDTLNLSTINKYSYYYIDDICVSTDSLYCENWLGIDKNNDKNEEISIYPNPATELITLQSEQVMNGKISIFNNLGLEVKEENIKQEHEKTIDIRTLPAGLYLLRYKEQTLRFSVVK
ncbi:MAG: T9SS type A sorting domain-containing protein [Bacteroidales bacterium]|nr:T9SS type A sorting domain-containing protein [Bacteroidales bacterium]